MFTIDFTKPFLYKDIIYFNQGNLAANNILKSKLATGGDETLEGYIATVTFKTLSHAEINGTVNIVDAKNCIVDIKFPSNALEVGVNELEVILTKGEGIDKVVTPSPIIKYEVWQCITTGNGIQGDSNYPILIDLISDVNNAVRIANNASATADASLKQAAKMLDVVNANISKANEAIDNTNSAKDEALNAVEEVNAAKNSMIEDINSTKNTVVADVNQTKNDMKITVDEAIKFLKQEYNSLTTQQQQDFEVLQARDGEVNLNARLERDLYIDDKSLKQEVLDLVGLKEVQEIAYSADKGYLVCKETKAGTVKDFKISGKSSINYCNSLVQNFEISATLNSKICDFEFKAGKTYTLVVDFGVGGATSQNNDDIFICQAALAYENIKGVDAKGVIARRITPKENVKGWLMGSRSGLVGKVTAKNFMILEGDHTQNAPQFFKGMASVGTGTDKIEISSVKNDGNLFDFVSILNTKSTTDKKVLLFKDVDGSWKPIKELRSCPECADSVELSNDGKYYYYIRTEKRLHAPGDENNPKVITDKTNTIAKLAKEKVYEVNPLFLESYENETIVSVNSGVINAPIEFKITSYVTNLVLLNQQRIKELENELYKTNLANLTVALNTLDTKLKLEQLTKTPK